VKNWISGNQIHALKSVASVNESRTNESYLRTLYVCPILGIAVITAENLVIDTNDPGRDDFVISVGALGNASGAPLDGSQNVSFGERTVDEQRAVDGNKRPEECEGMIVCSGSESSTSYNTPTGFDPSDPNAIGDLLS